MSELERSQALTQIEKTQPYLHFTNPGAALNVLHFGLFSDDFAKRVGQDNTIIDNRFQGTSSISLTDVKHFEQQMAAGKVPKKQTDLYKLALGMVPTEESPFYHKGGVCLLVSRNKVEVETAGAGDAADSQHYSAGYSGEVVARNRVAPREIEGIVFTDYFVDQPLFELDVESFVEHILAESRDPLLDLHQDIMVLPAFKLFGQEEREKLEILRGEFKVYFDVLQKTKTEGMSFYAQFRNMILKNGETLTEAIARLEETEPTSDNLTFLKEIRAAEDDLPEQRAMFRKSLEGFVVMIKGLQEALKARLPEDINKISDLLVLVARKQGMSVFDVRS